MGTLLVISKVAYIVICIALIGIVLMQHGKVQGLSGAIGGAGDSYWGKNKARSMEGGLHKATASLAVAFIVLTVVIDVIAELV